MTGEPDDSTYVPEDPREFCSRIFHTCYMGTENSSVETRKRAKDLAVAIGACVAFARRTLPPFPCPADTSLSPTRTDTTPSG